MTTNDQPSPTNPKTTNSDTASSTGHDATSYNPAHCGRCRKPFRAGEYVTDAARVASVTTAGLVYNLSVNVHLGECPSVSDDLTITYQRYLPPDPEPEPARPPTTKATKTDTRGPWHLVSRTTGKHHGPFTTEFDTAMARSIATPDWSTAIAMDRETLRRHLDTLP